MTPTVATDVVPFSPPALGPAETAEVIATLESGWLSTGPRVQKFEAAFARYTGAPHAVALNSCTAGLHLALLASGIGPGDEVVTTPLTFCATANVIVHVGATPVFADVDPLTGNLDPVSLVSQITPRTRAVIPVHYGGRPVDVLAIRAIAARHGLVVIEDAAHCVEGMAAGRKIGTTADFTCFSFYATKNLTTGEGGMVTTASAEAADRIRTAALHGMTRPAWTRHQSARPTRYDVVMPGFKYNMSDLQAAIGLHQLAAIDEHWRRRAAICRRYDEALADLPISRFAPVPAGTTHAHHLYTVLIDHPGGPSRDDVADRLAEAGVASSVHFQALHLHTYYADRFGFRRGQFPAAERIADTVLSLPLSPALTDPQVEQVIAACREALGA
ncbi:MAG: DegT/DnrJ/EryC1/StrS family aminotransferase [Acidobacteria bacterium]|nr:DegT/DnrJ/EryC1/StrS family aminotransferase [Acidobacteriota bacterium]